MDDSQKNLPGNSGMSRGGLHAMFWAVFLGTPVMTLVTLRSGVGSFFFLLAGAFFAGSILSKLFVQTQAARVMTTVLFGFMILFVYAGIAFAGCLVMLKNHPI